MPSQPTERPHRITNHTMLRNLPAFATAVLAPLLMLSAPAQAQSKSITNETAKLLAPSMVGRAVSINGNTAILGSAAGNQNGALSGAAYVFAPGPLGFWRRQTELLASDGSPTDRFGFSVSMSHNTAVIGAWGDDDACPDNQNCDSGSAYVFVRDRNGVWTQQAKLRASDATAPARFGWSVAINSDTIVVGAPYDNGFGSAYIFIRNEYGMWTQQAKLLASDGAMHDLFGESVAISGDTAICGSRTDNNVNGIRAGSAYIFVGDGNSDWTQQTKLLAPNGTAEEAFGSSVAINGNTTLIGAQTDSENGPASGSAHIFVRDTGGAWTQQSKLLALDGAAFDFFGFYVALSGDTAVVGAPLGDDACPGDTMCDSGSAYVFVHDENGAWIQRTKLLASDGASDDTFGFAVAISDIKILVGAVGDEDANGLNAGAAYIFDLDDDAHSDDDADFDDDGKVDSDDLSSLLSQWGAQGGSADLNKDGAVDSLDLILLLANWG